MSMEKVEVGREVFGAGKLPALHESLGTSVGFRFKR